MTARMKVAAVLAFIIGGMAIFSGGQVVLLGKEQNYYVISWLPYYNFTMGVITFFVTAVLLWKNSPYARAAALATLARGRLRFLVRVPATAGLLEIGPPGAKEPRRARPGLHIRETLVRPPRLNVPITPPPPVASSG